MVNEKVEEKTSKQKPVKHKVKFEVWGEEMIEKVVKASGNSGRVYMPPCWVGRKVKIVRID